MAEKVGKKTGKTTSAGRDVYITPEGENVSEKSVTIKFDDNSYVNAPSIHDGIRYSEDEVRQMLLDGKIKPTSRHDTLEEALEAAQERSNTLMNEGGMAIEKQMELFEDGGLMDEGGTVDPVSGNDVPPGSTQEEVRDDIPAQLSEGEFVFPADVVRYIGLGNLMRMRQEAKMGLKVMEEMGQMGNSEEATIPDDIPFDINDLDMEEEDEYNNEMEMAQGGLVYAQQGAFIPASQQQQQFGISGYQPAAAPTTGFAPAPTQAASQQFVQPIRPAQAVVPTMQQYKPSEIPTFQQTIGGEFGSYDELRQYKNEAGNIINVPFRNGQPISPIPEGYTYVDPEATATEEVTTTPTTPQTAQVTKEEGDGPSREPEYATKDVTGIGYDRSKLSDELRDAIDSYGFGFGALGEAFGKAGVAGALGEVIGKDKRAPIKQISSALFGGVVDGFRGGKVDIVNGRVKAEYADVRSFSDMDFAQQDLIGKTAKSVAEDMKNIFFDEKNKPKTESDVTEGLKAAASGLGISTVTSQGFTKSVTQLAREIGKAKQEQAKQAELEKQRQEIIKQQRETLQKQKEEGDGPATTGGDRYGTAGKDVSYGGYSGGTSGSGSFGMGYRAKGGLIEKPKPKKTKKMKRGGLASK